MQVDSVEEVKTRGGGRLFRVVVQAAGHWLTLATRDPFQASLCERARVTGVPIEARWGVATVFDHPLRAVRLVE